MESICRTLSIEKAPCEQDLILSNRWKKKESASRVDKSLCKLIMITKEKMLWSFIKWKWAEIGMENYCVRGVFLNFSCWQISWSRKSFRIILKFQLKKRPVTYWISWENSRDFTTPPLVSPRSDVLGRTATIPYLWSVITQIWVVLLIGWGILSDTTNQKHYPDLECWHTSFRGKTGGGLAKCWLFSQAKYWISYTLTTRFSTLSNRMDKPLWFLLQSIFQRTGLELSKGNLRGTGIKSCYSELTG